MIMMKLNGFQVARRGVQVSEGGTVVVTGVVCVVVTVVVAGVVLDAVDEADNRSTTNVSTRVAQPNDVSDPSPPSQ